jgi:hypothetical protein
VLQQKDVTMISGQKSNACGFQTIEGGIRVESLLRAQASLAAATYACRVHKKKKYLLPIYTNH